MLKMRYEIREWLDKMDIQNYTINDDLTVDVYSNVNLSYRRLESIPVQFRMVTGNFFIGVNELTSLKGCPIKVGHSFDCSRNKLQSLEYCPKKVAKEFLLHGNSIVSLEHIPESIGTLILYGNEIQDFNGLKNIKGNFTHECVSAEEIIPQFKELYKYLPDEPLPYILKLSQKELEVVLFKQELQSKFPQEDSNHIKKPKI